MDKHDGVSGAEQRHRAILRALRRFAEVRVADLAPLLGVTPMTIRRDLRELSDAGLLQRVHGGAVVLNPLSEEKTPHANREPRKTHAIGILVPAWSHGFRNVLEGAKAAADQLGVRLLVGVSTYTEAEDRVQVDRLLAEGIEGLLLTPTLSTSEPHRTWQWAAALPVPVVILERRPDRTVDVDPLEYVASDHEHGAIQAVRHLSMIGRRRIALITRDSPTAPAISAGFERAIDELALPNDLPRLTVPSPGSADSNGTSDQIERLLSSSADAVIIHPDEEAVMMLHSLRSHGISVPDDIAMIAYDDEFAALVDVPLTAISPPRVELGRTAMELLVHRVRGGTRAFRHVLLLPHLHRRASTAVETG